MIPRTLALVLLLTLFSLPNPTTANIPLTVSLTLPHAILPPGVPLSLTAATTNPSTTPVTLLTWSTPLDPLSAVLGIYTLTDLTTHSEVDTHLVSIRRAMPPPAEDFVQIDPGHSVSVEAEFSRIELVAGHEYEVKAEGWWGVVWVGEREGVLADEAKAERLEGGMNGGFESEGVVFSVVGTSLSANTA